MPTHTLLTAIERENLAALKGWVIACPSPRPVTPDSILVRLTPEGVQLTLLAFACCRPSILLPPLAHLDRQTVQRIVADAMQHEH